MKLFLIEIHLKRYIPIKQILIVFFIVFCRYQIYNNMMNMIIYTCNISNSCKTNNTILFKLKCIKKSPKI